jgi:hypothetical protein
MEMDDEKTIEQIRKSLNYLDSSVNVKTPDINEFVNLVSKVEEKKRYGKQLQFIVFMIVAIFTVSLETYSFYKSFTFFVIIQVITWPCILVFFLVKAFNKNRQVKDI